MSSYCLIPCLSLRAERQTLAQSPRRGAGSDAVSASYRPLKPGYAAIIEAETEARSAAVRRVCAGYTRTLPQTLPAGGQTLPEGWQGLRIPCLTTLL